MDKCVFLFVLTLLLIGGCDAVRPESTGVEPARIPQVEREAFVEMSGGSVLEIAGETVTANEIIAPLAEELKPAAQNSDFEQFRKEVRPQVEGLVVAKIANILLYQEAKKNAGEGIDEALEKAAEAEVRKFIAGFDNDYAMAEEALKEDGMDWQGFKEYQKKLILTQHYIVSKLPEARPIAYNELLACYNRMKERFFVQPATLKLRLIDIESAKLEVADPNQNQFEQAKKLANELVERIRAGEDFGELARQYSHGYRASYGGLWEPRQPESLAEPYDVLALEAEKLEPGQIAGPIETQGHIFIMKLEEKRPRIVKPLEQVQSQVEQKIIFDRRKEAVDELRAKFIGQAAMAEKSEFVEFCLRKTYEMSNQ